MKIKPFNLLVILLIAASVIYKVIYHFEVKLRFALLPFISDYSLSWIMDVMIGVEAVFMLLLLLRIPQPALWYSIAIYFSAHLALLAYQKLFTSCSECVYHSNFIGEPINISIVLFFIGIVSVLFASANRSTAK
ncbi:MAG: hypothetical protein WCF67_07120 [Chitinophagaceae bacterium]